MCDSVLISNDLNDSYMAAGVDLMFVLFMRSWGVLFLFLCELTVYCTVCTNA